MHHHKSREYYVRERLVLLLFVTARGENFTTLVERVLEDGWTHDEDDHGMWDCFGTRTETTVIITLF